LALPPRRESDWVQAAVGCGKATWVAALNSPEHREYLRGAYPELGLPENLLMTGTPLWRSIKPWKTCRSFYRATS